MLGRLGLALLIGAGLGDIARAQQDLAKFDGQYMGQLMLTKVISGDCTKPPPGAIYPLTISRGEVRFVYRPRFATALNGKIADDGVFSASARVPKGVVHMTGRVSGNNVTASIVSPSCSYSFQTRY